LIALAVFVSNVAIRCYQVQISRPFPDNSIQLLALAILVVRLVPYFRQCPRPVFTRDYLGLAFLISVSAFSLFCEVFDLQTPLCMSSIGLLAGFLWSVFGKDFVYYWFPVLFFSLFLIPVIPDWATSPLQLVSTSIAGALAGLIIPIT